MLEATTVNGKKKTVSIAAEDNFVLTNKTGESYVVPDINFRAYHQETALNSGEFKRITLCKVIPNPTGAPAEIMPAWDKVQPIGPDALIAVPGVYLFLSNLLERINRISYKFYLEESESTCLPQNLLLTRFSEL